MNGILQEKHGKYYVVLDYKTADGTRKRKWVNTGLAVAGNNIRAAKKRLTEILVEYQNLEQYIQNPNSFTEYAKDWLERELEYIDKATWNGYRLIVERHILPYFEPLGYNLTDITPDILQTYYNFKLECGRLNGSGGLSAKTVIQHHAVIHQVLKSALNSMLVPYNAADRVRLPKKQKFEAGYYTSEQIDRLLDCCKEEPLRTIIYFTAFYGLRRSEVIGLKWSAVNLEHGNITICHTVVRVGQLVEKDKTKNESSHRTYPITPAIRECLEMLRMRDAKNKRLFGREYDDNDYLFKWDDGHPVSPDYVSAKFRRILEENNLPIIRFHDLRHSCASILINMGSSLKDVQEWLGHADITMTGNVYGHLFNERKVTLAAQLESHLGAATE